MNVLHITKKWALPAAMAMVLITSVLCPVALADKVITTWLGNSFSGGGGNWVQDFVFAMAVTEDGRVFTCSHWDEAHREAGIYEDGKVIGNCRNAHGDCVAVDRGNKKVYLTDIRREPKFGPIAEAWIREYTYAGTQTNVNLPIDYQPVGLAVAGKWIVVSDTDNHAVKVYDRSKTKPFKPEFTIKLTNPGDVCISENGEHIWAVGGVKRDVLYDGRYWRLANKKIPATIRHYAFNGKQFVEEAVVNDHAEHAAWLPTTIAIDNRGRLIVGDNGPRHQVLFYDVTEQPKLVDTFGREGGIAAGTPGLVEPLKFWGISGAETDKHGNIYVSMSEQGSIMRKFKPDGELVWELVCLNFVDVDDFDPASDGTEIFGRQEHYVIDYTRPPGQDWTFKAYTLDATKYPQDPRLWLTNDNHHITSPFIRRMNDGQRYMFATGMYSEHFVIYRFDGYIAVPSGMIPNTLNDPRHGKAWDYHATPGWPPHQPEKGLWIWRDSDGEGDFDKNEYHSTSKGGTRGWGWWVDTNGDIWQTITNPHAIRKFPLQGFDKHGNPIYAWQSMTEETLPEPFNSVTRIEYHPDSDTMYLCGYTDKYPFNPDWWKDAGKVIARYDDWSKGNRKYRYTMLTPWDLKSNPKVTTIAMTAAGDYLFTVGVQSRAKVWVFDNKTGKPVRTIEPDNTIGGIEETGWVDIPNGVQAMKRENGEYLILVEEDYHSKVVLYRWIPD